MALVSKVTSAISGGVAKAGGGAAVVSFGVNALFGVGDYKAARAQGDSKAVSLAKSVGSFAVSEALGFWSLPIFLAPAAIQGGVAMADHTAKTMAKGYDHRGKLGSGYFEMTNAGYTMRQRSLNAIRSNGLNVQSALGNEARSYFKVFGGGVVN